MCPHPTGVRQQASPTHCLEKLCPVLPVWRFPDRVRARKAEDDPPGDCSALRLQGQAGCSGLDVPRLQLYPTLKYLTYLQFLEQALHSHSPSGLCYVHTGVSQLLLPPLLLLPSSSSSSSFSSTLLVLH